MRGRAFVRERVCASECELAFERVRVSVRASERLRERASVRVHEYACCRMKCICSHDLLI